MLKERWCMIMTKTWRSLLAHPERRRGHDRRQCPDRRLDARLGESTSSRRYRERRALSTNDSLDRASRP